MIKSYLLSLFVFAVLLQSCEVKTSCDLIGFDKPVDSTKVTRASLSSIQTTVFDKSCATVGCHVEGGDSPLLTKGKSYSEMVGVASLNNGSMDLVKAGDPTQSYLLIKLYGTNTALMPKGGSQLPQNVIDSISAWIAKGAPND